MKIAAIEHDSGYIQLLSSLINVAKNEHTPLLVGYDETDNTIKFKVGYGVWTSPIKVTDR